MHCLTKQWWVFVFVILCARGSRADPLRISVDDAVKRAVATNLDLRANRKDVSVAEANLERSRALLPSNPSFTAGGQYFDGFAPNYSFSLSQEFEVAGQRRIRINAAQKDVEKAGWEVKSAERTMEATAKTAFVHALISIDRVTAAQQGVETSTHLIKSIETGKRLSDAGRIELNQARIQAARNRRALAWAENTRDTAFGALRSLLGLPVDQEIVLTGAPETAIRQLPSDAELTARALDRRSDLIALRHAAENADLHVKVTRREGIPNVTLSGTYGRFESNNFAGGDLTVPLPVFQRKGPEVHEALAEYERTSLQVQNLERDIAKTVIEARQTCTLTGSDLQIQQQQIVPMSEENLEIQEQIYRRGEVGASEVIGLQVDLLTARHDYLDALEAYNNALIELERVSGSSLSGS